MWCSPRADSQNDDFPSYMARYGSNHISGLLCISKSLLLIITFDFFFSGQSDQAKSPSQVRHNVGNLICIIAIWHEQVRTRQPQQSGSIPTQRPQKPHQEPPFPSETPSKESHPHKGRHSAKQISYGANPQQISGVYSLPHGSDQQPPTDGCLAIQQEWRRD